MNIIKIVFNLILEPLLYIFNQIIHISTIPNQMKIAKIIPIYKNGKHEEINNYPISLLAQFSKIFEKFSVEKCYYLLIEIIYYIKINMVSLQMYQQYMHIYIIITF